MKKQIPLEQLKLGMFLLSMDQSWWKTPFLVHHRFIKSEQEIEQIRNSGVRFVVIDTSKGLSDEPSESHDNSASFEGLPSLEDLDSHHDLVAHPSETVEFRDGEFHIDHSQGMPESEISTSPPQQTARDVRTAAVRAVEQVFEGVRSGEPLDHPLLEKTTHAVVQQVMEDPQAFPQLVLVENLVTVDKHLYSHVVDVCALGVVLGIEMGLDESALQALAMGGLLHDIGYLRLPGNLVRNRKQISDADRVLLAKHSDVGHAMVSSSGDLSPDIKQIIQEHHERLDGSGEPRGLPGESLSLLGQIIGLVDQFDQLTSNWGLGPMRPTAMVLRDLYQEAKNGLYPLRPIERLIQCLGVYPLGSLVELSTGEQGIVIMTNPSSLLKPKLKLIVGADHLPYPAPLNVDLACPISGDPDRSIRSLLDAKQEQIQVEKYLMAGVS
jgi:HD-GYP domain-containing protein (c-di-GMP phosphodiesterase class II)